TSITIGKDDRGRKILGLRVENAAARGPSKPAHLVVGTHHGNEPHSADLALAFAERLLEILGGDSHPLRSSLSGMVFHVVPVLNIEGYNANRRYEFSVDPNRDYPDPCDLDKRNFQLASTRHLARYVADQS